MTSDYVIDPDDTDDDDQPGTAYLRISRDATPDDVAAFLPDKSADERAEWLRKLTDAGTAVTIAVTLDVPVTSIEAWGESVPVRTVTGLIMGPPGSEQYLRRPGATDPELGLVGAHELAAAKLIVQYGTLNPGRLANMGADSTEIGGARAVKSWGPLDPARLHEVAVRHVPPQVYGPVPDVATFLRCLDEVGQGGRPTTSDRDHAGLGLGCTVCGGPCTIDEVGDGE